MIINPNQSDTSILLHKIKALINTNFPGLTKWLTPEDNPPLGLNNLKLEDIRESANYTCEAASVLGVIEAVAEVKVQCKTILLAIL